MLSWEGSYNASKKVLNEEIHEVKISWRTSYLLTWRTSHCGSNVFKNDLRIGKLDAWKTRNDITWEARNLVSWKTRNLYLAILTFFSVALVTWTFEQFGNLF